MSEQALEQQMHKLRTVGEEHAKAKEQLTILEHGRQILMAELMKEYMVKGATSVAAQERDARSDARYKDHINALGLAVSQEAKWAWEKKIVDINFERWKTNMINQTIEKKQYNAKG